jgi:hypothetical protein
MTTNSNSTNINTNITNNPALTHQQKKLPSPAEFLRQAVGRIVTVKLTNDEEYRGN